MPPLTFTARLHRPKGAGTWTYLTVPGDAEDNFGTRKQVRVKGTMNGEPVATTLLPNGKGQHCFIVNATIREALGVAAGHTVRVSIEADSAKRMVETPTDLLRALRRMKGAVAAWEALAPSHKKAYVEAINEAKKPETRTRRVNGAVKMIVASPPPRAP